jgi:hypothetical protein
VKDIENAGSFIDKQDPGLVIKIGNDYTFTTDRIQDGGTDTSFPEKYDDIVIAYDDIKNGIEIEVEVHNMDKNNKSKKLIGFGKKVLRDAIPKNNQKVVFTIPLNKGKSINHIIIININNHNYHHRNCTNVSHLNTYEAKEPINTS